MPTRPGFVICAAITLVVSVSLFAWNYDRVMRRNYRLGCLQRWAEGGDAAPGAWKCTVDLKTGKVLSCTENCPWSEGHDVSHMVNVEGENVLEKIRTRCPSGGGSLRVDVVRDHDIHAHTSYATSQSLDASSNASSPGVAVWVGQKE